jgi:hypothetical protein
MAIISASVSCEQFASELGSSSSSASSGLQSIFSAACDDENNDETGRRQNKLFISAFVISKAPAATNFYFMLLY